MGEFASDQISSPRWNSWSHVSPVQFEERIDRFRGACGFVVRQRGRAIPFRSSRGDYSARCV
jgi:hypothetical protein